MGIATTVLGKPKSHSFTCKNCKKKFYEKYWGNKSSDYCIKCAEKLDKM